MPLYLCCILLYIVNSIWGYLSPFLSCNVFFYLVMLYIFKKYPMDNAHVSITVCYDGLFTIVHVMKQSSI